MVCIEKIGEPGDEAIGYQYTLMSLLEGYTHGGGGGESKKLLGTNL